MIVLENVRGALTSHAGRDFAAIGAALTNAGYRFGAMLIDAVHFEENARAQVQALAKDPEKQKLLKEKEQIEQAIDELKYRKASMAVAEYRQQLSKYLVDLAKTQEALDK